MKKRITIQTSLLLAFMLTWLATTAQFTISGQLRTRTEWRDGTGTLRPVSNKPAFFTSQRARLAASLKSSRVLFHTSIQDVRVWGQDASSISPADGNRLGVHEAWAELVLANKKDTSFPHSPLDYFAVKVGRQELVYDDSRLLGNLDWLQQARRHDAMVFKLLINGWQVDAGVAFNQNTDAFNYNGTYYTPANVMPYVKDSKGNLVPTPAGLIPIVNTSGVSAKTGTLSMANPPSTNALGQHYKALQFLYAAKAIGQTKLSALLVSDQFSKYKLDSVRTIAGADTGYVYGRRYNQAAVNTRVTGGFLLNSVLDVKKRLSLQAGIYGQSGKDKEGFSLSAFTSTLSFTYSLKKWMWTAGWDYLSGNDAFKTSPTNHRFDPLYGTPHKFWGLMDYFYAGTGSPAGGLNNPYLKIKYTSAGKRFSTALDYHYFSLASNQKDIAGNAIPKYLGSEIDWVSTYALNKMTGLELGVSWLAASRSMEYAKNLSPGTTKLNAHWAYLQINVKPEWIFK
ncbi:MAG TPA: alginate export family protein [Chitinophagaceae bacterium]|nr:alginate export family protein [Chitinophagaceae bacterium]